MRYNCYKKREGKTIFFLPVFILVLITFHTNAQEHEKQKQPDNTTTMSKKKVTGVGGIFFKCQDPEKMREWYANNLGFDTNEYGAMFEFRENDNPEKKAYLQWSPFSEKTKYFEPSEKQFMINYRVENIEELVEELKATGVTVVDTIETYEYGKFVHIMDPEGNKIELWEPVDEAFTETNEEQTEE